MATNRHLHIAANWNTWNSISEILPPHRQVLERWKGVQPKADIKLVHASHCIKIGTHMRMHACMLHAHTRTHTHTHTHTHTQHLTLCFMCTMNYILTFPHGVPWSGGVGRGTVYVEDENQLWNEWYTRKSQSPPFKKSAQASSCTILKTLLSWTLSEKKSTNIPPHFSSFRWRVMLHPTANLSLHTFWMAARRASRSVHTSSGSIWIAQLGCCYRIARQQVFRQQFARTSTFTCLSTNAPLIPTPWALLGDICGAQFVSKFPLKFSSWTCDIRSRAASL